MAWSRAAVAAALALFVGGDVARLGAGAVGLGRFAFPYLWLFLLLEAARSRRRIEDGEVFLAGAAMAMFYGGVYVKDLQHGFYPLGIDWLGAVGACFDGGMTAVLALHLCDHLRPRDRPSPHGSVFVPAFLIFVLGGAACVYGVKTAFDFYRAERLLGPTWLLGDLLFSAAAGILALRAKKRSEEDAPPGREPWLWGLAAFVVWLPGARLAARLSGAAGLPDALLYFFVGAWSVAAAGLFLLLWRERGHADIIPVSRSRAALIAAIWRAGGAIILVCFWGSAQSDVRTAGVFSSFVDLPTRALFAWIFLTSRLKV